ncbi:MAG: DUF1554 domain-containing protein [Leptospira sp.]|nr:DUF1554 domain-containing protein [Leptospira sp.]
MNVRLRSVAVIFCLFFVIHCKPAGLENSCDPNSESFSQTFILRLAIKEPTHCLYPTRFTNRLIVTPPAKGFTLKNGGTDTVTAVLSKEPTAIVKMKVIVTKPANVLLSTPAIEFTSENWNIPQTITLTGVDDNFFGVAEEYVLKIGPIESEDPDLSGYIWESQVLKNRDFRRIIYSTNSTYQGGALGGVSGADAICNSDSLKPVNTGVYKALIVDGVNRRATLTSNISDSPIDWVLVPNQLYIRPTGITITTTNVHALHDFTLNMTNSVGTSTNLVWTGLNANWTTAGGCGTPGWTDTGLFGRYGNDNGQNDSSIDGGNIICNSIGRLFCVQQ